MDYRQPPLNRGINPLKMNWLWRLICQLGYVTVDDVVSALRAAGTDVGHERVLGWLKAEGDSGYFPLTIAELEQNVRMILAARSDTPQPGEANTSE